MHHEFWIVTPHEQAVRPGRRRGARPARLHVDPAHAIPDYLVMCVIIVVLLTAL